MQPDPSGPAADAPAPETTAEPSAALDTESTADGSPAVESQGDEAEATDQPTPESDDSAEDDGDDEDSEQTEEQRKLSRRERQRLREQERIDKAVEERIAAREREAEAQKAQADQEAAIAKAREDSAKEFAEYIGEPGEADRLTAEIDELNRQIRAEVANPQGVDLDDPEKGLLAQVAKKEARKAEITRAQGFQEKIAENIWNGIEAAIYSPLQWPEFSDPATKARYMGSEGGIAGALGALREIVRAAVAAEKDAEIAKLKEGHTASLKAIEADRNAWRARAGGAEVVDTSGGTAANGSGVYTRERLRQMMASPEGIAEYRRNKAEIARQEAAGLIR